MKAVIFGGTTEGRQLSSKLAEKGVAVLVSVATPLGQEEQEEQVARGLLRVHCGRLEPPQMVALLKSEGAQLCIDATHPYAVEATRNIRAAAAEAGVEYLRLARAPSEVPPGSAVFDDAPAAAQALAAQEGNILLTTGAKELVAFAAIPPARLFPRVLPTHEGIAACEGVGIPHRNIIAMQGPFTREMNEATLRQYHISHLVTKDGGAAGGFAQKAQAAALLGVQLVVLRRPPERGLTETEILRYCEEKLQCMSR